MMNKWAVAQLFSYSAMSSPSWKTLNKILGNSFLMLTDRAFTSVLRGPWKKSEIEKQSRRIASCNSKPCSCPQVTSKLEVARWAAVSPGSGKHIYFTDVFQVQGGTNRMRGGLHRRAKPPPVTLSACSECWKNFWPRGWVAALFSCDVNSQYRPAGWVPDVFKCAGVKLSTVTGVNKLNVFF